MNNFGQYDIRKALFQVKEATSQLQIWPGDRENTLLLVIYKTHLHITSIKTIKKIEEWSRDGSAIKYTVKDDPY